jgi:hypothetical protein
MNQVNYPISSTLKGAQNKTVPGLMIPEGSQAFLGLTGASGQ